MAIILLYEYERIEFMTNLNRLKMEVEGIELDDDKLSIYLQENNLNSIDEYTPTSNINKKNIYCSALAILESIANNPTLMRNYKTEDFSILEFSENLNNRIDALERKVRLMSSNDNDEDNTGAIFVYPFMD